MTQEIPKAFIIPWTGRDFASDDDFYEPPPIELNRSQCIDCDRVFFVNHHNLSHNTFARCFNSIDDKEELQILWYPHCSSCLRVYTHDANMHWPQMNGWFVNWNEHYGWDAILHCVRYRHSQTNAIMLPLSTRIMVALRVFQFLALRGKCFPAQRSISQEEDCERRQRCKIPCTREKSQQQQLTAYFPPKKPKTTTPLLKRKREDVLQSSACMRALLRRCRICQPWVYLQIWDCIVHLCNQLEWILTMDAVSSTNCVIRTSLCSKQSVGPCMLDHWAMEGKSSQLIVYCIDTVNHEEVWSLWKDECRTCDVNCEFMSSLFITLKNVCEEQDDRSRFQLSFVRESNPKNWWTHIGGRCMLIIHQYIRRPWLMKACAKWKAQLKRS